MNWSLGIGPLPGRKSKAIWIEEGGRIDVLAYFKSDEAFTRFKDAIGGKGLVLAPPEDHDA